MTSQLRAAAANQSSHWLAQCLLLTRMELAVGFNSGKARVAAVIRAELGRRGVPTKA